MQRIADDYISAGVLSRKWRSRTAIFERSPRIWVQLRRASASRMEQATSTHAAGYHSCSPRGSDARAGFSTEVPRRHGKVRSCGSGLDFEVAGKSGHAQIDAAAAAVDGGGLPARTRAPMDRSTSMTSAGAASGGGDDILDDHGGFAHGRTENPRGGSSSPAGCAREDEPDARGRRTASCPRSRPRREAR